MQFSGNQQGLNHPVRAGQIAAGKGRWWNDLSIRTKLTLMMVVSSSVALLLAFSAFWLFEITTLKKRIRQDSAALTARIAETAGKGDLRLTEPVLQAARQQPHIVALCLYDQQGKLLARYAQPGTATQSLLDQHPVMFDERSIAQQNAWLFYRPIRENGALVGVVAVQSDLSFRPDHLDGHALIALLILLGSLLLSLLAGSRLQRLISEPMIRLSQEVERIVQEQNYGMRVSVGSRHDELGELADGLNDMLQQIQLHKLELQQRNQALEQENLSRRHSEELLQKSEERYRTLITQSSEAIWRFEFDVPVPLSLSEDEQIEWYYRYAWLAECNEAMARMYAVRSSQDMIGMRSGDMLTRDDPRNVEYLRSFIRAGYRLNEAESFEADKDGNLRYIVNNLVGVIEHGCVVRVWGMQRDITPRKQIEESLRASEKKYRDLFNQIADAVFIFDKKTHRFLDFNERVLRVYGYSVEELRTMTPFDLHPLEEHEELTRKINLRNSEQAFTWTHLTKSGRQIAVETVSNEIDYQGRAAFLTIVRDITDRREAEARLLAFNEQLKRSNAELEQFAHVASHDLQEPLRKVQAFGDRLHTKYNDVLGADGQDYLARMQNAASRMQTLIQDLLTFSRVASKAQPFKAVDLAQITREVLSDLEIRIEQTSGRVEIGDLPMIDADPMQMRQLLQNLIGNALKFHRPGVAPVVRVTASIIDEPFLPATGSARRRRTGDLQIRRLCRLMVEDNGIGFDEKFRERIFIIFQRLQGREEYEGTGVGLAVCRKIVERHAGTITAHSEPGQGAKFIVTLPVIQEAPKTELQARAASQDA